VASRGSIHDEGSTNAADLIRNETKGFRGDAFAAAEVPSMKFVSCRCMMLMGFDFVLGCAEAGTIQIHNKLSKNIIN